MQLMKRNKPLALLPDECFARFQETVISMAANGWKKSIRMLTGVIWRSDV